MNIEEIIHLAKTLYSSCSISIKIYQDGSSLLHLGPSSEVKKQIFADYDMKNYDIRWTDGVKISVHPAGNIRCEIQCPRQNASIILGPVNIADLSPLMIYYVQDQDRRPVQDLKEFLDICSFVYTFCTNEKISLPVNSMIEKITALFSDNLLIQQNTEISEQTLERDHKEMQIRMQLLQRGKSATLKELNQKEEYLAALLHFCTDEHTASTMLTSCLYVAMHYAVLGGIPVDHAGAIVSNYLYRFRSIKNKEESVATYNSILETFASVAAEYQLRGYSGEIEKAVHLIRQNMNKKITIKELASEVNLSPSHFMHRFKEETGMTVINFIQKEKIEHAKLMLAYTQYSVSYIAEYLMYSSQSYFITVFKKETGVTPLAYRHLNS